MTIADLLINQQGHLRSGWRFLVFFLCFMAMIILLWLGYTFAANVLFHIPQDRLGAFFQSTGGFFFTSCVSLVAAILAGWICLKWLEELPWRALGWGLHRGWLKDFLLGSLYGCLSLSLATLIGLIFGGYNLAAPVFTLGIGKTLLVALLFFVVAAAFEEALFRGYPLQTLLRSCPVWVALIPSFLLFAVVHLNNPNVARGFTFINTALAGIWLSVGYLRTRSLWFPLGLHWAWNWTMGPLYGLPVSGLLYFSDTPLLHLISRGPDWLTGGAYGPEGGINAGLALIISTLFLWRTRTLGATEEMMRLTSKEGRFTAETKENERGAQS